MAKNATKAPVKNASKAIQNDGWENINTGLGRKRADSTLSTKVAQYTLIDDPTLASLWMSDGIGAKIVRCQVDDAIRPWFTIEGDTEGRIVKELNRLKVKPIIRDAAYWAKLYGGAIIVMGWADGLELEKPRATSNRPIQWLRVYPATRITFDNSDIDSDPSSPNFEQPFQYKITLLNGSMVTVHYTRCLVLKGVQVPGDQYTNTTYRIRFWGMSVLQQAYQRLSALGSSFQALDGLLQKFAVGKYRLGGLRDALASKNSDAIYKRMEIMNASMSIVNGVFLDAEGGEDFTRDIVPLGGVTEFLDREMMALCGCPNVPPLTRLFGRSPSGLNATGESDLTNYYDDVEVYQTSYLEDVVFELCKLANAGMPKPLPEANLKLVWGKPKSPSQVEDLEMRSKQANIDKIYIDAQVYSPEEVRESRFANGYSFTIDVEPNTEMPIPEEEKTPTTKANQQQGGKTVTVSPLGGGPQSASGAQQKPKNVGKK